MMQSYCTNPDVRCGSKPGLHPQSLDREAQSCDQIVGRGDDDPGDGVKATRLMPDLHLLPGLWSIDGYGQLLEYLHAKFTLTDGRRGLLA